MKILGIIPARYGSSRFEGKPLALINGRMMIQRVYEQAKKADRLAEVVVATDDRRIYDAVVNFGGKVVMTSSNHKSGTDRCREVVEKVGAGFDAVINIQGDEPYINPLQINQIAALISDDDTQIASLCKPIRDIDELLSHNAVKVVVDKNGKALYFSRYTIPFQRNETDTTKWMQLRTYYKHIGIYAYKSQILKEISALPQSGLEMSEALEQLRWLENGYAVRMGVTEYESYSVDVPDDIKKIETVFKD
ncbi:MAG: 3-deoxy-manno-octulosonate cytidylyltransferase [Bacteroidales bacterium]|nr:3-deoxy-manno-octulosonate cytidylyltransferase [Bacteroidales bacterium]